MTLHKFVNWIARLTANLLGLGLGLVLMWAFFWYFEKNPEHVTYLYWVIIAGVALYLHYWIFSYDYDKKMKEKESARSQSYQEP